jgi:hypothetical protein
VQDQLYLRLCDPRVTSDQRWIRWITNVPTQTLLSDHNMATLKTGMIPMAMPQGVNEESFQPQSSEQHDAKRRHHGDIGWAWHFPAFWLQHLRLKGKS